MSAEGEHTLDGTAGALGQGRVDRYLGSLVAQAVAQLDEGVELHVRAVVAGAGAVGWRGGDECLAGTCLAHLVQDAALGGDDKLGGIGGGGVVEQGGCGAYLVGYLAHGACALGVRQHTGLRMLRFQGEYLLEREFLVHVARTVPEHHASAGDGVDIVAQIAVGAKYYLLVGRQRVDDAAGVARGDKYVGEGLHAHRGVDIRHHGMARMSLDKLLKLRRGAGVGQRASRRCVGHEHLLVGAEQLGGLAHEVHAAQHDDAGVVESGGIAGQSQRVAYMVGNVLDGSLLIVVGQNHGALFLAEAFDFSDESAVAGEVINTHFFIFLYLGLKKFYLQKTQTIIKGCKYVQ